MSGTGWLIIIVFVICALSAVYYLITRRREARSIKPDILDKDEEADTQTPNPERSTKNGVTSKQLASSPDKRTCSPTSGCLEDEAPDIYGQPEAIKSVRGTAPHYYRDEDGGKSPVRHDYQKLLEDSILTPFPEESSPAIDYLREAYRLEKEGADRKEIDQLLNKAKEADPQNTDMYLIRLSIIKKRESRRTHYKQ